MVENTVDNYICWFKFR